MRNRYSPLALLVGLGLALLSSLPSPAGEAFSAEKIDKLIKQMGSDTFAEREKATKALDAIGAPALEALRKAAKGEDNEVKRRAEELVKKIEKHAESAQLLAAKRVHLVYKDTPVSEALADFQKKSGYTLSLHDPEGKLKERRITLDTGETTFWHAFGLFCEKAGLVEATAQDLMNPRGVPVPLPIRKPPVKLPAQPAPGTLPAKPAQAPARGQALAAPVAGPAPVAAPAVKPLPPQAVPPIAIAPPGAPVILPAPAIRPWLPGMNGQIVLKDGKPQKLPTDDRSAVRVRALPKADVFGTAPEGEVLLALEVAPEPKLQWQGMQSIRIDKALDDQGQKLTQITPQVPAAPGLPGGIGGPALPGAAKPAIIIRGGVVAQPAIGWWGGNGMNQQLPVHLKKGAKAAKSLKELTGVISAFLLSEAKPMITANLVKSDGKTFKGAEGGSIKILEVRTSDKQTTIRFEFEQPQNTIAATTPANVLLPVNGPVPLPPPPAPGIKILPAPVPPAPGGAPAPAQPPARRGAAVPAQAKAVQVQVGQAQAVQVQVQIQGGGGIAIAPVPIGRPFMGGFNGLTVQDDKGNILPVQLTQHFAQRVLPGGGRVLISTYTFICQAQKGQGQPARIIYSGRKHVAVDIPFTLKDVPLP